ncbi:uncharacterized protein DNG_01142 [Cephalotrichum gorgonifer]|uniref:Uncharacterized protein n=1 Tax=Cephalotrichum gorgonifer TaxID=2041049 RepID=A0AAE8MQH4_9PEZI|nr:uncharacterized protein DNG_01142 [Cephalotrichum gorgonifer]
MGASADTAKTLLIPGLISLTIFLVSKFLLVPIWRAYRQRYSQYLPLGAISAHTMSLRERMHTAYTEFITRRRNQGVAASGDAASDDGFMSEDGEELGHVNQGTWNGAPRRADSAGSDTRLSRDLEEGFISDSDGEVEGERRQNRR